MEQIVLLFSPYGQRKKRERRRRSKEQRIKEEERERRRKKRDRRYEILLFGSWRRLLLDQVPRVDMIKKTAELREYVLVQAALLEC